MILNTALQAKTSKELPEIVNMFECLLCFEAWLNRPMFWRLDDPPWQKMNAKHLLSNKWKCAIPTVKDRVEISHETAAHCGQH